MKNILIHIITIITLYTYSFSNDLNTTLENDSNLTKEEKLLYLNIATSTGLVAYGLTFWGYDFIHTTPHAQSEGWFEKDSKHGGADKFGHAYTGYLSSHLFSYAYQSWGYNSSDAAINGAVSSFVLTSIMEIGDSFSPYGLSYEDIISNTIGAVFGYYSFNYPYIKNKIDYRVEYKIHKNTLNDDFSTDYENIKYLFVLKGSGFKELKNTNLKYLELYIGYNINGFDREPYVHERDVFIGVGLNLSKILNTKIFNYYQIPNIYSSKSDKF